MKHVLRRFAPSLVFIFVSLALAAFSIFFVIYTTAYSVYVDDEIWGYITDPEELEQEKENIEEKVSEIRGEAYTLDCCIEYEETVVRCDQVSEAAEIGNRLYESVPGVTEGFTLRIDDRIIGIGEPEELTDLVNQVACEYLTENTISIEILSDLDISYETVPSETEAEPEAIADTLDSVTEEAVTYTAQEGDTVEKITEETGLSENELISLNPDLEELAEPSPDSGEPEDAETCVDEGKTVVLAPERHTLVVETHELESHEEDTAYKCLVEETDELTIGETELKTEGQNGTVFITENVTYQNGVEVSRCETERIVTVQAVDEVTLIGTKEPEKDEAAVPVQAENTENDIDTGIDAGATADDIPASEGYIWPLENSRTITSSYGPRTIDGQYEYHRGIDISAAGGTPILASKSGVVVASGWGGDRGWYVQIDHRDGYRTIYQHMNAASRLNVNDTVTQGQVIGYVGSTGYSFGNHLHFEVWVDNGLSWPDNTVDPMTLFDGTRVVNTAAETGSGSADLREQIVSLAESYLGCPYVYGGHGPDMYRTSDLISWANGAYGISIPGSLTSPAAVRSYALSYYGINIPYAFDCSGFTGYLYRQFGYTDFPYNVEGQLVLGTPVSADVSEMKPGDLIFFATTGTGSATHVGMYVGGGQYIHASSTAGSVVLDTVRSTANRPIVGVRRIMV